LPRAPLLQATLVGKEGKLIENVFNKVNEKERELITIFNEAFKEKKVINIGVVSQLTGLSQRKIRYYEQQNLISPTKYNSNTRKYSFSDIEKLMAISDKIQKGIQTSEIRREWTSK
jgi:MerR family transcriptional regulator, global nitrogen regulator